MKNLSLMMTVMIEMKVVDPTVMLNCDSVPNDAHEKVLPNDCAVCEGD